MLQCARFVHICRCNFLNNPFCKVANTPIVHMRKRKYRERVNHITSGTCESWNLKPGMNSTKAAVFYHTAYPKAHSAISGSNFSCHKLGGRYTTGSKLGMVLSITQYTGQLS